MAWDAATWLRVVVGLAVGSLFLPTKMLPSEKKQSKIAKNRGYMRRKKASEKARLEHEKRCGEMIGVKSPSACASVATLHDILDCYQEFNKSLRLIDDDEEANAVWNGFIGVVGEFKAFVEKVHTQDAALDGVVQAQTKEKKKEEKKKEVEVKSQVFETAEEYQDRLDAWNKIGEAITKQICGDDVDISGAHDGTVHIADSVVSAKVIPPPSGDVSVEEAEEEEEEEVVEEVVEEESYEL